MARSATARLALAAACVLGLLVVPAVGRAALTNPITAPSTTSTAITTQSVVTNATSSSGSGGISSSAAIGIAIAAVVIIVVIGSLILRDARRRTRSRHGPVAPTERIPGSKRPPKPRKLSPAERRRRKRGRNPKRR